MTNLFQIDEKFDPSQDEYILYLKEIEGRAFNFKSGLVFINSLEMDSDPDGSRVALQNPLNQSWGILEEEVSSMQQELARLIRIFENFYYRGIAENKKLPHSISPIHVTYLVKKLFVRIKRMVCVLDPDYSVIKFNERKSGNEYNMVKGYWVTNDGVRVRSLSRNIGNNEASINELTMKLFKLNSAKVLVMEPEQGIAFRPDLIVADGKNTWLVETDLLNFESFVRTYVMFELWKMYKKEYELLGE